MKQPERMKPMVSIVVPVHNESGNVEALIAEIDTAMIKCGCEFETIFVDDASTDDTYARLQRTCERAEHLRVMHHPSNCGQSMSILTGVRAAYGKIIAALDGDGQNDPADIPRLVAVLEAGEAENLKMVAGVRRKRRDTAWRRFSSRAANRFRSALLKDNIEDTGCGLKVFYRDAFLALPRFNHMHRFLPALIQRDGGRVASEDVALALGLAGLE